jgi:hypothetical protein
MKGIVEDVEEHTDIAAVENDTIPSTEGVGAAAGAVGGEGRNGRSKPAVPKRHYKKKVAILAPNGQNPDAPASHVNGEAAREASSPQAPGVRSTKRKITPTAKIAELNSAPKKRKGGRGAGKRKPTEEGCNGKEGAVDEGLKKKEKEVKGKAPCPPVEQTVVDNEESLSAADALASLASMAGQLEHKGEAAAVAAAGKPPAAKRGRPRKKDKTVPVAKAVEEKAEQAQAEEGGGGEEQEQEELDEVDVLARLQIYAQQMGYVLFSTTITPLPSLGEAPERGVKAANTFGSAQHQGNGHAHAS